MMVNHLNQYQKNKHRISIGSCSQGPLFGIKYILQKNYPQMNMKATVNQENEVLIEGLNSHHFSIIILDYPIYDKNLVSTKLFEEKLYLAVEPTDPLSQLESITFEQLDGTNVLMLSNTGYWYEICQEKLPHSLLLVQNDIVTYQAIQKASSLPNFRTNLTIPKFKTIENRVYIPIVDKEAKLTFYAVYHKNNQHIYDIITAHLDNIPWENYQRNNE